MQLLKQVEELTAERDDARSQVEDLLRAAEDNENSLIRVKLKFITRRQN